MHRAAATGLPVGVFFGALAWLDSGLWQAGLAVTVLLSSAYGVWMARRMSRYWPAARSLTGSERVAVVRAARRGDAPADPRLAPAVVAYDRGMHQVADDTRSRRDLRWLIWLVLAIAAAMAIWDTAAGSARNGIASVVYLGLLVLEFFWWPRRRDRLIANADRSAAEVLPLDDQA